MMDVMKILIIQDHTDVGGASISLLGFVKALSDKQYEISIITNDEGILVKKLREAGASVLCNGWHRPLNFNASVFRFIRDLIGSSYCHIRSFYMIYKILKTIKPDIVYINTSPMLHLAPVVRRFSDAYIIYHVREHWNTLPLFLIGKIRSRILKNSVDYIITNTTVAFKSISMPEKSSVVHNWPLVENIDDCNDVFSEYNIADGLPVLLVPGGRIFHKGSVIAMEAMGLLRNKNAIMLILGGQTGQRKGIRKLIRNLMIMCGMPPYGARMDILAKELGLCVKLVPYSDNIAALMKMSACVISPFTKPHFSRPAIEAGILGRPIILSDCAEAREVITHGENGLLTPIGDAGQLAEAIDSILENQEWAEGLGVCAQQRIELDFGLQANVSKIIKILQKGRRDINEAK